MSRPPLCLCCGRRHQPLHVFVFADQKLSDDDFRQTTAGRLARIIARAGSVDCEDLEAVDAVLSAAVGDVYRELGVLPADAGPSPLPAVLYLGEDDEEPDEEAEDPDASYKRLDFAGYSVPLKAFEPSGATREAKTLAWLAYLVACEASRIAPTSTDRVAGCFEAARKILLGLADHHCSDAAPAGEGGAE